jgi:uncharacterized protein YutE (UPF0331/DUF86 family)
MIDPELVTRKISLIMRDLDALGPIAAKSRSAYLESRTEEVLAERYLERIIGRMIDINYHLLTETGHPPPSDYHTSFSRLAEIHVLDREFASRIARCAGLRNGIVHEYNDLDPSKVFDALQDAMRDIPQYLQKVNDFVARGAE